MLWLSQPGADVPTVWAGPRPRQTSQGRAPSREQIIWTGKRTKSKSWTVAGAKVAAAWTFSLGSTLFSTILATLMVLKTGQSWSTRQSRRTKTARLILEPSWAPGLVWQGVVVPGTQRPGSGGHASPSKRGRVRACGTQAVKDGTSFYCLAVTGTHFPSIDHQVSLLYPGQGPPRSF